MVKLKLEINKTLSYRVYDEFDNTCIKTLENGNFLIETELQENEWLYGYILSYGENIKVLSPNNIRESLIEKLKQNLQNYL